MRHRLEDLGRILVLIDKILESELFNEMLGRRAKDAVDFFNALSKEKQDDLIHDLSYKLSHLEEQLADVLVIAKGYDELNDKGDQ